MAKTTQERTYQERIKELAESYAKTRDADAFKAGLISIKLEFMPDEIKNLRKDVAAILSKTGRDN